MAENLEGQIKGINLASFLQIVQMEKSTCTLNIKSGDKSGVLYIQDGELIDAETKSGILHLDAALEIIAWEKSSIELNKSLDKVERFINMPLMTLLMEGTRLKDEKNLITDDIDDSEPQLEMENLNEEIEEEIPEDFILKEIDSDVDKYDLSAELKNKASVTDFTEEIVSPEPEAAPEPEKEKSDLEKEMIKEEEKIKARKKRVYFLLLILLISILGFCLNLYLKNKKLESEYNLMIQSIDRLDYEDQKIIVLKKFINNYPDSSFGTKAGNRLNQINNRTEKESYQLLQANIKKLEIDDNYKKRALKFYRYFLAKFPRGNYSKKVKQEINNIPEILADYELGKIKDIPSNQYENIISEIDSFKKEFKDKRTDEIIKILNKTGDVYLQVLKSELSGCNNLKSYNLCLKKAEDFESLFPDYPDKFKAKQIKTRLENQYWADSLLNTAKAETKNIEDEKVYLENYLKINNDFIIVVAIRERIAEIDKKLRLKKEYESIISYSENKSFPLENRINRLKAYIFSDIPEDYKLKASQELKKIDSKTENIEVYVEKAKNKPVKENAIKILNKLPSSEIINRIKSSKRFKITGKYSFTDQYTGKIWTINNSDVFTDSKCLNYENSKNITNKLEFDGYTDWRIPTEQELITLFKNSPFFPVKTGEWFWSSNIFEKGFNTYSAVVNDDQTEIREKTNKNIFKECSVFKAVRP